MKEELERSRRVADQFLSSHAVLAERYATRAFILDISILLSSVWLNAMVFVEPAIHVRLTPAGFDRTIWIGLLAISTFFLSLLQLQAGWKNKSEAHHGARRLFASVKGEINYLLSRPETDWSPMDIQRVRDSYDMAGTQSIAIPEGQFNKLKRHHKLKIEISRYLDDHPGTSIAWLRMKIWCRDNLRMDSKNR